MHAHDWQADVLLSCGLVLMLFILLVKHLADAARQAAAEARALAGRVEALERADGARESRVNGLDAVCQEAATIALAASGDCQALRQRVKTTEAVVDHHLDNHGARIRNLELTRDCLAAPSDN